MLQKFLIVHKSTTTTTTLFKKTKMGYGYLGSYIAYGFNVHDDDLEHFKKQCFEKDYIEEKLGIEEKLQNPETCVYHDPDFPHLFIKEFGTDDQEDNIRYFIYLKTCFRGGEFWKSNCIGVPQTNHVALCPVISAQTFLDLEKSCDKKEFEKFQTKYKLKKSPVGWTSLICFGQLIY